MSTSVDIHPTHRERELVAWAAELGASIAGYATGHDREGSFVSEAYDVLRSSGYLALAVPEELGGRGATIRHVAMAQRELARHCASTALASVMHHHVVLFTAWRYRRGLPGAEATLRRVASDGIVLVSTGGADLTRPRGTATRLDGGYLVSGRKIFTSQSPVGTVLSTMFPFDDPDEGRIVLNMAVPLASDGVTVIETWDALGMRGTGSHDIELTDVFVPDERVLARRPYGKIDGPLQVIMSVAMPPIAAVYLGVAEAARDLAVAAISGKARADDQTVQRQVGLMDTRLKVAGWALDGALGIVGDDPAPSMDTVAAVMAAKREIALAGIEVCDLAMDAVGGASYYRTSGIEQCYRDIRGAKYHPFSPEESLVHAGKLALGLPADDR
ncbi:MAG: acyl-CoA dehydrogenase family protein [Acidimicrobiia bacterium]